MKPPIDRSVDVTICDGDSPSHSSSQLHLLPSSSPSPRPRCHALSIRVTTFLVASLTAVGVVLAMLVWFDWQQLAVNLDHDRKINSLDHQYRVITRRINERDKVTNQVKQQRLPQAIIIGARKSGTRALLEALSLHPRVATARYEVHYFDQNDTFARGDAWYRRQMPFTTTDQLTIEKTPAYLTNSLTPGRVAAMNASMRLIVIVRDPVTRTISDYSQVHQNKVQRHKPHAPFEQLVFDGDGRLIDDYKPVRNSLYAKHLRRWLRHFDRNQILIVDGDKFTSNPLVELRRCEQFLGLPPTITSEQLRFNATKGFYCFQHDATMPPKCLGDTKGRPHVFVSDSVKRSLREQFRPYNERFFDLVGRRFDW